jgi:hypothetical protein
MRVKVRWRVVRMEGCLSADETRYAWTESYNVDT